MACINLIELKVMGKCQKSFRNYGSSHDNFGKYVKLTYRKKKTYGTALGGYMSLMARIVIITIAIGQIYACFFEPKYVETERSD